MASFLNTNVVSVISTQHSAITFLTDSIRRNMDAGQLTGAIFIDFHKAFDTIDHTILLDKLHLFGIYDSEHCWMTDYLILSATSDFWSSAKFYSGPSTIFLVCHRFAKCIMCSCMLMIPSSIMSSIISAGVSVECQPQVPSRLFFQEQTVYSS